MNKKQLVLQYCRQFKMGAIATAIDQLVADAQTNSLGYLDFTEKLLATEAAHREQNDVAKRLKAAKLPRSNDLGIYDHTVENGLSKIRLNQLRELNWLDQIYNIMLMGPSGTGKTYLAAGLCADAVKKGYKAYFRTMEDIINILKTKDVTRTAMADYKRLSKASLIVIDDIMLFPVEKNQAVAFFNFINSLYEKTSFIITTNKKPTDWANLLQDEVLATALLDRLLYQCEVINLTGKSYRLQNRKTIFDDIEN
jgi:DNA replication protein DnaC